MPKPRRVPYVVVEATIRRNAKLADLPNDTARLGYVYVLLAEAKLLRPQGRFVSRAHFEEIAGRFARYYPAYVRSGLLEVAPSLCTECRLDWPTIVDGQLVVHNYRRIQSDPWSAERADGWRSNRSDEPSDGDGLNGDQTAIERNTNGHGIGDRTAGESVDVTVPPAPASPARASRQRDREISTTPQPPASGGRRTRARDLGPMRSPTRYDDLLERDDEPADVPWAEVPA